MRLVALQTKLYDTYEKNLLNLEKLILKEKEGSLILAPELCLTNYSYENQKEASSFSEKAKARLLKLSQNKTIALTIIEEIEGKFYNTFYMFSQNKIIHKQSKIELFKMNDEEKYFTAGKKDGLKTFKHNGLKIGVLICFELRFIEYWQKLRGADIILIPAMWGAKRKENFEVLSNALAVANQCFVVASNSADKSCCKSSAIITPFGEKLLDDSKEALVLEAKLEEIHTMRKNLNVGIN